MTKETKQWTPDESQQRVIDAEGGYHLVLAPPGCGKTQILTERVRRAHDAGIAYTDMLCLTFTNRAARGMQERIAGYIADDNLALLYVGNIHRFCSRYLFEHHIVASGSAIIDDDDALSILARYLEEDENRVKESLYRRQSYAEMIHFSHFMHQIAHGHPRHLRLHPECLTSEDIAAMKYICQIQHKEFTAEQMTDMYEHVDFYRDATRTADYDMGIQASIQRLLTKMRFAHAYTAYCRQNKLLDFEDLLLLTYDALTAPDADIHRYPWIQVDEVQDLNAMQLAIIDLITDSEAVQTRGTGTVMYLGDGQQAIFSFMGAKLDTLSMLRDRCDGHIHHLRINHRSPRRLLQVFNDYAAEMLHVAPELLPAPSGNDSDDIRLHILSAPTIESETEMVTRFAAQLQQAHPADTTAIIVTANRDADAISRSLANNNIAHFKVSGLDLFASAEVKLLFAHLNVLANGTNFMAWSRLLWGLGVYETHAAARALVRKLLVRAILPSDLLRSDGKTYTQDFADTVAQEEVVVFDTETTGLNVFEDDIIQIAAMKMRGDTITDAPGFCIHIETERPIPEMLGDTPNPILAERRRQHLYSHEDALRRFLDYVGDRPLVGHNVEFDYHILDYNLRRYLPSHSLDKHPIRRFDTLTLLRLFHPELLSHRLDDLRRQHLFGLSEDNAHLADVDVADTCKVVAHCLGKCRIVNDLQAEFLCQKSIRQRANLLQSRYAERHRQALEQLYELPTDNGEPAIVSELRSLYLELAEARRITPNNKVEYVFRYLAHDVVDAQATPYLITQLQRHLLDINTLKEADLCGSSVIDERIFVSTVHKAKGLEFDNVIVFDVVDGRYPNYYHRLSTAYVDEDKRKLYVALSRAKRRLYVSWNMTRIDTNNQPHKRELSPFMRPILKYFDTPSEQG